MSRKNQSKFSKKQQQQQSRQMKTISSSASSSTTSTKSKKSSLVNNRMKTQAKTMTSKIQQTSIVRSSFNDNRKRPTPTISVSIAAKQKQNLNSKQKFTRKKINSKMKLSKSSNDDCGKKQSMIIKQQQPLQSNFPKKSIEKMPRKSLINEKLSIKSHSMHDNHQQSPKKISPPKTVESVKNNESRPMMIMKTNVAPTTTTTTNDINPQYLMDEKQIIELFKSFLRNISCQKQQQQLLSMKEPESKSIDDSNMFVNDKDELEELNAELIDLFGQINTVQSSYQEIVQSLISIQKNNRPHHKFNNKITNMIDNCNDINFVVVGGKNNDNTNNNVNNNNENVKTNDKQQVIEQQNDQIKKDRFKFESFMNPSTRNESFNQLFQCVEQLRIDSEQFRQCFTLDGTLQRDLYDNIDNNSNNNNNKLTRKKYKEWHEKIQELSAIIELILQEYNREVLELFRLSQTTSSINDG